MQLTKVLGLAMALAMFAGVANAQSVLSLSGAGNVITVNLDAGDDLQGWSWGICNAPEVMATDVADGSTAATVNGGSPADFNTINIFPEGWSVGLVISFLGANVLPAGAGYEMNIATYDVAGLAPGGTSDVCTCDNTIGSPPTANVVVVSGASFAPDGADGACGTIIGQANWGYDADEVSFSGAGPSSITVGFYVNDLSDSTLEDTQGFSMGWSNTSMNGTAATPGVAQQGPDVAALNGGAGADFFGTSEFGAGWTVGCVYAFLGGQFLTFPAGSNPVALVDYSADITQDDMINIAVDNGLGSPPVANVVVVAGNSFDAFGSSETGKITLTLVVDVPFIRGDCNDDGIVNIADSVWSLNELFQGGPTTGCAAACDSNGDGMFDATDASYTLNWRFLDGPPPPAPFPDCGIEAGADCTASSCP